MHLRWIQLPFHPDRGGFDEAPLAAALGERRVLDAREYFFEHEGRPYLGCFLEFDDESMSESGVTRDDTPPRSRRGTRASESANDAPIRRTPKARTAPAEEREGEGPPLDAAGLRAAAELRRWRSRRSKELGIPAYRLLSNRTLEALARMRPVTLGTLLEVTGIGTARVSAHGDEILGCLRSAEAHSLLDSLPLPTAAE
ncbi:MAG: HRDC domain-containing protein [Planctomycetota bacterium]